MTSIQCFIFLLIIARKLTTYLIIPTTYLSKFLAVMIYIYRYRYKVFLNKSQEGIPALNFNLGCLNIRTTQIYSDYLKNRSKKKCPPPFSPPAPPPLLLLSLSADLCHRLRHVPAASRPPPATAGAGNDDPLPIPLLGPFLAVSTWADTV